MFLKFRYIDLAISLLIACAIAYIALHLIELKNCDEIGGEIRNFSCNYYQDTYYVIDSTGTVLFLLLILAFAFLVYVLLGKMRRNK